MLKYQIDLLLGSWHTTRILIIGKNGSCATNQGGGRREPPLNPLTTNVRRLNRISPLRGYALSSYFVSYSNIIPSGLRVSFYPLKDLNNPEGMILLQNKKIHCIKPRRGDINPERQQFSIRRGARTIFFYSSERFVCHEPRRSGQNINGSSPHTFERRRRQTICVIP